MVNKYRRIIPRIIITHHLPYTDSIHKLHFLYRVNKIIYGTHLTFTIVLITYSYNSFKGFPVGCIVLVHYETYCIESKYDLMSRNLKYSYFVDFSVMQIQYQISISNTIQHPSKKLKQP